MRCVTRTVDDIEQALADLVANYSVEKGNESEPLPYLTAFYRRVLDESERPLMVVALRRWLSPEQYLNPAPGQPSGLWWTAKALAAELHLTDLAPDLMALAEVAESRTPSPDGIYTAKGLRATAAEITTNA
jgi:hypothetical protein